MQTRMKWSVIDTHAHDAIVSEHDTREEALAACPRSAPHESIRYAVACPWPGLPPKEPSETTLCS
jgi:hypothetical protein